MIAGNIGKKLCTITFFTIYLKVWGQTSLFEIRPHSVRVTPICEARPQAVNPYLILWGKISFCDARHHFVRPEIVLWGQTSFCKTKPHCVWFVIPGLSVLWSTTARRLAMRKTNYLSGSAFSFIYCVLLEIKIYISAGLLLWGKTSFC